MPTISNCRWDRMILRNEDVVRHPIGPYMVRALNEITVVYGAPGVRGLLPTQRW